MGSYTGEVSFGCSDSFNSATFTVSGSVTRAAPTLQVYDRATELQNAAVVDLAATASASLLALSMFPTPARRAGPRPESLELPAGFSLVAPFASRSPRRFTSFTVQLDATTAEITRGPSCLPTTIRPVRSSNSACRARSSPRAR